MQSRAFVVVLLLVGLSLNKGDVPRAKQILCNIKFPDFANCVKEDAHPVISEAMDKCKEERLPNTSYSEFANSACKDDKLRESFLSCIKQEKRSKDVCVKIPKKCFEKVDVEPKKGHGTLGYFCTNKNRICCIKRKAPLHHRKAMDECLKEHVKLEKGKKFLPFICDKKRRSKMTEDLENWKECYLKGIGKNSTSCAPSYINECKNATSADC